MAVVTLLASTGSGRVSAATGGSVKKRHQDLGLNLKSFSDDDNSSDEDEKPVANGKPAKKLKINGEKRKLSNSDSPTKKKIK